MSGLIGVAFYAVVYLIEAVITGLVFGFFWAALVPQLLPNAVEAGFVPWNLTFMQMVFIGIAWEVITIARLVYGVILLASSD